ncbi:MAG: MATE family efflux transporter [Candidatus Babeliales bacterium]
MAQQDLNKETTVVKEKPVIKIMPAVTDQKPILASYIAGIKDTENGESISKILSYFVPEFITALVLYSLTYFYDSWLIAHLKSTSLSGTAGTTNTLLHVLTKMAEGFTVSTMILAGLYNGRKEDKRIGRALVDAFWVTTLAGTLVACMLFFGAYWIYYFLRVPEKMISLGTPYLRTRAVAILFMYVYFALIGFLRGIKNTRAPMMIFILGASVFMFFDYALIFGAFGLPALELQGSAVASLIQFGVMLVAAFIYIFTHKEYQKYGLSLFSDIGDWSRIKDLLRLTWPVMLDKVTFAMGYLWLAGMINPMGKYVIASFSAIKDLERLAIMPAAAFAQVITFLVSNSYGIGDWQAIKSNLKKVVFLASIFVFAILFIFSMWPAFFIGIFDHKGKYTEFAAAILPLVSVLVFFDLLQLIFAGALRGAANVKLVMYARLGVMFLFFIPTTLFIDWLALDNVKLSFLLMYGSFYVGNGLISLVYMWRFRGQRWTTKSV